MFLWSRRMLSSWKNIGLDYLLRVVVVKERKKE